jgi:hypothetical protein
MPGRLSDATSVATPKGLLFVSSRKLLLVENRFFRNSIFVGYFKVLCYVFS